MLFEPTSARLLALYIAGTMSAEETKKRRKEICSTRGPYDCPCYKHQARTDRCIILNVALIPAENPPEHWILCGVGLLCSKDQGAMSTSPPRRSYPPCRIR